MAFLPRICALFLGTGVMSFAQTAAPANVSGVPQPAIQSVKEVAPNSATSIPPVPTGSSQPQAVNKVDGIDTINGVKASGRDAITPPPPPPPVSAGGATVGSASSIQAVKGVSGLNTLKRENLEAALLMKEGGNPTGSRAETDGKGKSAAAALLGAPKSKAPPKSDPKDDGRNGFQEFEKLTTNGS